MRPTVLRPGTSGPAVRDLQIALNARLNPSPRLPTTGQYDQNTARAVRAFQVANWLEIDGIAGACTLDAVHETELAAPILHNVPFLAQPDDTTCWAAATAMIKGSSVAVIRMATPAALLGPGGLLNESEAGGRLDVHHRFARIQGLRYHPPQSWGVASLIALLRRGPLMMEALYNPRGYRRGQGSPGHYYVIVGARGSHGGDGQSTTLRLYDPAPPNEGEILSWSYATLLRTIPLGTYGIFST